METFVVVPCLNEEDCLSATCASLGFGNGVTPPCTLVLVDNGSTDGTYSVMCRVRDLSTPGRVLIVQEPQRGYVSARRAGMAAVLELTAKASAPPEEVLVFQADADTIYLPGYIEAMTAACTGRRGELLEGCALTSREFNARYPAFTQLCRDIDGPMERWFAPETEQVVIDDKLCAFLLADYCEWGEHQEEVDPDGQSIYAETTRLFLGGRRSGVAWRHQVEAAQALPSRRKLMTQAFGYFASSGFPRGSNWMNSWGPPAEADAFLRLPRNWPAIDRLVRSRQRHQLVLFGLLPTLCSGRRLQVPVQLAELADQLYEASSGASPGHVLRHLLVLADQEDGVLDAILAAT